MAVDQARGYSAAFGVDDKVRLVDINILVLADRGDAAVDGNNRIGIEDRLTEIAREQQADVAHDELALHRPGGSFDGHSGAPQSSQAQQRSWRGVWGSASRTAGLKAGSRSENFSYPPMPRGRELLRRLC